MWNVIVPCVEVVVRVARPAAHEVELAVEDGQVAGRPRRRRPRPDLELHGLDAVRSPHLPVCPGVVGGEVQPPVETGQRLRVGACAAREDVEHQLHGRRARVIAVDLVAGGRAPAAVRSPEVEVVVVNHHVGRTIDVARSQISHLNGGVTRPQSPDRYTSPVVGNPVDSAVQDLDGVGAARGCAHSEIHYPLRERMSRVRQEHGHRRHENRHTHVSNLHTACDRSLHLSVPVMREWRETCNLAGQLSGRRAETPIRGAPPAVAPVSCN